MDTGKLDKIMLTIFQVLKDLSLAAIVFAFPRMYSFVVAFVKIEDVRFFLENSKELMSWLVTLLILIKVAIELREKIKKK